MKTVNLGERVQITNADCIEAMQAMASDSIDAIVTDPPYGLEFMGKQWDHGVPGVPFWVEALRVLKPGGHLLAFGGTRTYHRLAVAIEDAGFEIRDCLSWMYGSGFPKSMDVSKAIDKAAGATREVIGASRRHAGVTKSDAPIGDFARYSGTEDVLTGPATPEAEQWTGWGTALKPSWEPIIMARKTFKGTVAKNVLEHGTGALNIDATRIGFTSEADEKESKDKNQHADFGTTAQNVNAYGDYSMVPPKNYDPPGRWPANTLLSHHEDCSQVGEAEVQSNGHFPAARGDSTTIGPEGHIGQVNLEERVTKGELVAVFQCVESCPIRMLDAQTGTTKSTGGRTKNITPSGVYGGGAGLGSTGEGQTTPDEARGDPGYGDVGGASRFFYSAKTPKKERNAGMPEGKVNSHPTVKPVAVMSWLIKMVTPPGGTVLDPFMGSGSTGVAAAQNGFGFIGIDLDTEHGYCNIAWHRIKHAVQS